MGHRNSLSLAAWPEFRADAVTEDEVTIVVQVNGKLRSRFAIARDADEMLLKQTAMENDRIQKFTAGKTVRKVITVKNKLVNIVV